MMMRWGSANRLLRNARSFVEPDEQRAGSLIHGVVDEFTDCAGTRMASLHSLASNQYHQEVLAAG